MHLLSRTHNSSRSVRPPALFVFLRHTMQLPSSASPVNAILHRLTSNDAGLLELAIQDFPSKAGAAIWMQALEANIPVRCSTSDHDKWFDAKRAKTFRLMPQPEGAVSSTQWNTSRSDPAGPSVVLVACYQVFGQILLRSYDIVGHEHTASLGLMVLLFVGLRLLFPSTHGTK